MTIARKAAGAAAAALIALVLTASPAAAHGGDDAGPTNYLTTIDRTPEVEGLTVRSVDLSTTIELRYTGDGELIVLGYEGEPYLRIDDRGVHENERSPATYLNASRKGDAEIPAAADAEAEPEWRKVSDGSTARWHDHRSHWMSTKDPPAVREDPTREHVVLRDWEIPLVVDGDQHVISGDLTWTPGPSPTPWWALTAAAAALTTTLVLLARRRWGLAIALVTGAIVVVSLLLAIGFAAAPDSSGPAFARFAASSLTSGFTWALAGIGVWWLLRRQVSEGVYLTALGAAAIALITGLAGVATFNRAHVGSAFDPNVTRAGVAICLGAGAAVAVVSLVAIRRRWSGAAVEA